MERRDGWGCGFLGHVPEKEHPRGEHAIRDLRREKTFRMLSKR